MEQRPYQQEAVKKIGNSLRPGSRIMYQLPTGGGKTHVAIEVIKRWIDDIPSSGITRGSPIEMC